MACKSCGRNQKILTKEGLCASCFKEERGFWPDNFCSAETRTRRGRGEEKRT